jgi:CRP/FNR family cyclic AMP-dependent transcriptional regulator
MTAPLAVAHPARVVPPLRQASSRPTFMLSGENAALRQPDLLGALDPAGHAMVVARGRRRLFKRSATVFRQDDSHDGIFLVETGLVRVFYTAASGREITLAFWAPGSFVGGPEVFGSGNHVWSGVAARESQLLWISGADMRALVQRLPSFALGIIDGLAFKGTCYSLLAQMLGTRTVMERLACVLCRLMELYGVRTEAGISISSPFTHDNMAHMVGATRQWVSITLRRFADQGILVAERKDLLILRPDWLAAQRDNADGPGG